MGDIWAGQRNRPRRLFAVQLEKTRDNGTRNREFMGEELAGADILYLTSSAESYSEVSELADWARQRGILVLWNPGRLKNARMLPTRGCVILQSELSAEDELEALRELFCTPSLTTTLDRETLVQTLQEASRARLAMVKASGSGKNRNLARSLACQGWQMPREGALVVSIGSSADCRLEEVVELWHGTVKRTGELDVLWGTAFNLEQSDTLRLVLMVVTPGMPNG